MTGDGIGGWGVGGRLGQVQGWEMGRGERGRDQSVLFLIVCSRLMSPSYIKIFKK